MEGLIHENHNYIVEKGAITLSTDEVRDGYNLVNKATGIIEYQAFSLPQILEIAETFDHKLQAAFHKNFSYREEDYTGSKQADMLMGGDTPVSRG